jgi:hypothetical protein
MSKKSNCTKIILVATIFGGLNVLMPKVNFKKQKLKMKLNIIINIINITYIGINGFWT